MFSCSFVGWFLFIFCSLSFASSLHAPSSHENFKEELLVRHLIDGKVLSHFSFTSLLHNAAPRNPTLLGQEDVPQHHSVFPLALGRILREYAVDELHLSLNAGQWRYDRWGYPEEPSVGTGAELWAWMSDGGPMTIDERWSGLRNSLAGLFCASIGSMDERRTTSPRSSFSPEGDLPDWRGAANATGFSTHGMRHAFLPSEHVCTENLTPFRKLLPCKSLSGLAQLLDPHHLFDADWHGMGVHVRWLAGEEGGIEVRLTFQMVSDPLRVPGTRRRDWSFEALYGRTVDRACPVAQSSTIAVTLPFGERYAITPEPGHVAEGVAYYDVAEHVPLNVGIHWLDEFHYSPEPYAVAPFAVQRKLHGASQDRGQLSVTLQNKDTLMRRVKYVETLPWFAQLFLHTMTITVDDVQRDDLMSDLYYIPPIPHGRPTTLEVVLSLPPQSTMRVTFEVKKAFLRYTEHPPDAQRGWDLPPAIIISLVDRLRIYTPALLIDLATPDFSMPYNVIIFSCSLIAFLFGSVFNLLTRRFVVLKVDGSEVAPAVAAQENAKDSQDKSTPIPESEPSPTDSKMP
ncbi:Gpi16 subunit, GPI transamidase component [Fistulina hepatica ATCC 64428]|uniref:Gpi16 subunit, GPI transamidase component n=1 Tax=Fistulina hepatica ATCC 64428 TaxID=1128425 RepID=A0A0D7AR25_9AGAR|nr:Gpi16 subunit, GPI transamidase component [Fistulina hepatica ATCC 64428]